VFSAWTGACALDNDASCIVDMTQARTVGVVFSVLPKTLTITGPSAANLANGSVSGLGVNCLAGTTCTPSYDYGTTVTLTANPATGYSFAGWGGACSGTGNCVVSMTQARSVTAEFSIRSYTLLVVPVVGGSVASGEGTPKIACGATCSASYTYGSAVTLTATEGAAYTISGWTGCDSVSLDTLTCSVTVNADTSITVAFTVKTPSLTVSKAGAGSGTVTGLGIDCGATCTGSYTYGTVVSLTAAPATGSTFSGWSGCDSTTGTTTCNVSMTAAKTPTATFAVATYVLTAVAMPNGTVNTVNGSNLAITGIDCSTGGSPDCTESSIAHGTTVKLRAFPSTNYSFSSWGGACATQGQTCTLTMTSSVSVWAYFTPNAYSLTALVASGAGTIYMTDTTTGDPLTGIACGSGGTDCTETILYGDTYAFSALGDTGYTWTAWGGDCAGQLSSTCVLEPAASGGSDLDLTIEATFTAVYLLTVTTPADGSVSMSVGGSSGITCPTNCTQYYPSGSVVTLSVTPDTGFQFVGWGDACSSYGTSLTCQVTMSAARTVSATFSNKDWQLTMTKPTNGTVTSSPAGISCGTNGTVTGCAAFFQSYSTVTLTATGTTGYTLANWGGTGGCTPISTTQCEVVIGANPTAVTATFGLDRLLTVTGNANGNLISVAADGTPLPTPGIDCGNGDTDCAETYGTGAVIRLLATPASAGYGIGTWTGCNSYATKTLTNDICVITMSAAKSVAQAFPALRFPVTVMKNLTAGGSIVSSPTGISCGTACASATGNFTFATGVTLTVTPASGYAFLGWTAGPCAGTNTNPCGLGSVPAATTTFEAEFDQTRSVTLTRPSLGTITTATAGLNGSTLDCGPSTTVCTSTYRNGTSVELLATPLAGYKFVSWSTCPSGTTSNPCAVTLSTGNLSTAATFTAKRPFVSVTKTAAAGGSVTSSPTGISCGTTLTTCQAQFNALATVTLTATPASGWAFLGWTTGPCSGSVATSCGFMVPDDESVTTASTVNFVQIRTLTVTRPTNGTITADTAGYNKNQIDCGPATAVCSATFLNGTSVSLLAAPIPGYKFTSWSSCPSGTTSNPCVVTFAGNLTTAATFTIQKATITVTKSTAAAGSVTSSPSGLSACGAGVSPCTGTFNYGATVTLTASAATGYRFVGFTGCTATTATACTVSIQDETPIAVTATYIQRFAISLRKTNAANTTVSSWGSVTSSSSPTQAAQFSCLTNCSTQSVTFDSGMTVTVTATAVSGRKITGWSGVTCTNVPVLNGTSSYCTFVVTGTATVRVTYA
jgi:hypothetical protein